jgi:hypothetical protein
MPALHVNARGLLRERQAALRTQDNDLEKMVYIKGGKPRNERTV